MNDRVLPHELQLEVARTRVAQAKRQMTEAAQAALANSPRAAELGHAAVDELNAALRELADVDAEPAVEVDTASLEYRDHECCPRCFEYLSVHGAVCRQRAE
jgi:hypothetical protein